MGLAATEEADEPDILLLAAGGFRDLTRLASSNPALWSQILLSNREAIAEAIELYAARLADLRAMVLEGRGSDVERTFEGAKQARLRLVGVMEDESSQPHEERLELALKVRRTTAQPPS